MTVWLAPVFLFATLSPAQDLPKREFDPTVRSTQSQDRSAACRFGKLTIPRRLRVYAAGAYGGRELPFQIDQSGHEATQFDIAVNSPGRPVALLLGAYEPTIWNISWTKGTRIVAVFVTGYHRQAVAGLTRRIPVLNSSHDNQGPCGYFHVAEHNATSLSPLSRKLFRKRVHKMFPADRTGTTVVGDPLAAEADLFTAFTRSPESFRDPNVPLAGQAGIDNAVRKGLLRRANSEDADAWLAAVASTTSALAGQRIPTHGQLTHKAYVVLKEFTYPNGLFGANAVTFIIPRGVPEPTGDPGHSAVYDFNTLLCRGAQCP